MYSHVALPLTAGPVTPPFVNRLQGGFTVASVGGAGNLLDGRTLSGQYLGEGSPGKASIGRRPHATCLRVC